MEDWETLQAEPERTIVVNITFQHKEYRFAVSSHDPYAGQSLITGVGARWFIFARVRYLYQQLGLPRDLVFVDVGAYVGLECVLLSDLFARAVAIEPDHRSFQLLKRNIQLNKCANTIAINSIVGESGSKVQFAQTRGPAHSYVSTVANIGTLAKSQPGFRQSVQQVKFTAMSLGDIKRTYLASQQCGLLWLTTVGMEQRILSAGAEFMRDCAALYMELRPAHLQHFGEDVRDLQDILSQYFNSFYVVEDNQVCCNLVRARYHITKLAAYYDQVEEKNLMADIFLCNR